MWYRPWIAVLCALSSGVQRIHSLTGTCQLSCLCTTNTLQCVGFSVNYIANWYGTGLQNILISGANLPVLDQSTFAPYPYLLNVTIINSRVSSLASDTFSLNTDLTFLSLSQNLLSGSLWISWITNTPSLATLDMSLNVNLEQLLVPVSYTYRYALTVVDMSDDPAWCDCEETWLKKQSLTYSTSLIVNCVGPLAPGSLSAASPYSLTALQNTCPPPLIIQILPSASATPPYVAYGYVGSPITLACQAIGPPAPEVWWTFPNTSTAVDVPGVINSQVSTTWANFTLSSLSFTDAGFYTCNASTQTAGNSLQSTLETLALQILPSTPAPPTTAPVTTLPTTTVVTTQPATTTTAATTAATTTAAPATTTAAPDTTTAAAVTVNDGSPSDGLGPLMWGLVLGVPLTVAIVTGLVVFFFYFHRSKQRNKIADSTATLTSET